MIEGCRRTVVLPLRYRSRLEGRADVRHLAEAVQWVVDDERALEHADAVVISRRPADQVDLVRRNLGRENIGKWLLEKPLAPSPGEALRMIGELEASGKRFCIGYTLLQTPWAEGLLRWLRLANPDGAVDRLVVQGPPLCYRGEQLEAIRVGGWRRPALLRDHV